ncbi:MAG: OmpH family outer membrane protein [Paramuribaculum sp.]|nr:OmpH family outer membrane protein [Paramuribaculum sp.]MDE5920117.1 OmpH family outer membrane protein [Paramuribaculum sp.]
MIKKLFVAILIALPAIASAQAKFGVVNSQQIFAELPETKEAETQMEAASAKFQSEFKVLQDEYNKAYTEFQNMDANTPETIRQRRMADIQEKAQRIGQFQQSASEDLDRQQQQLLAPIQQKIADAIKAVGQENNFTMIFDMTQPVYVGTDVVDASDLVKKKLGIVK